MKKWIAGLLLSSLSVAWAQVPGLVTLTLDNVPVAQVLQALAAQENQNLVVPPEVKGVISLRLVEVPWQQALQTVASSAGLTLNRQGAIWQVNTTSMQRQKLAEREAGEEKRKQNAPLHTQSISLRYADASELAQAGEKLLSPQGTITVDTRLNRLLVRDNKDALGSVKKWIALMDLPVEQVELAAHIVTISDKSLRELGVKWGLTQPSSQAQTLLADLPVSAASTRIGFNIGSINSRMLDLELSALEQKQQLEIIASPRLLASHRQPASIKQGSEIPYQVSSGESGKTSVEFKEAVLGMEVTPTVLADKRVRLKLRISQNMPGRVLQQAEGETLAIDKQEIETLVEVKSGETLALGGIFSQKETTGKNQIPVLGTLPGIGRLFRHTAKDNERRELVVFITPRLAALN